VACLAAAVVAVAGALSWTAPARAAGSFRFPQPEINVTEGQTLVRAVVERTDLPVSRASVDYRLEAVTADEGRDFAGGAGRLMFDVGDQQATIVVYLRDDDLDEGPETLVVQLLGSSTASATVTILDDDRTPSAIATTTDAGTAPPPPAPTAAAPPAAAAGAPAPPVVRRRLVATTPVPPAPRRVTVRQSPVTPFELRPAPGSPATSVPGAVDPAIALLAALLLAKVAAEVWFRARAAIG
jgi:hypothetical protein